MGKISSFLFLLCSCACTSCDFTSFAETDEKKNPTIHHGDMVFLWWAFLGFSLFFHSNYWTLHLFIPKTNCSCCWRHKKHHIACAQRYFSRERRKWKWNQFNHYCVFFVWERKEAKLAFLCKDTAGYYFKSRDVLCIKRHANVHLVNQC